MKIGLYFGSFNPVHVGHLIIANHVLNESELEKIWFIVSPQNPFKQEASLLNEYHRLHLVRLATENDPRIKASEIEFALPRPSYTIDTLTYLSEKFPEHAFSIIMGSDSYQNLPRWKNGSLIMAHYDIYVYQRPSHEITEQSNPRLKIMKAPLLELTATHIRKTIAEGRSIRYMVPDAVLEEITKGNYYRK